MQELNVWLGSQLVLGLESRQGSVLLLFSEITIIGRRQWWLFLLQDLQIKWCCSTQLQSMGSCCLITSLAWLCFASITSAGDLLISGLIGGFSWRFSLCNLVQQSLSILITWGAPPCKLERWWELTQDVPRVEETGHTFKALFIHAERSVENAKMADVNTHGAKNV